MTERSLRISELAARAGVSAKAIRFYEAAGVLPPAARGANGYRLYSLDGVDLLRFIKQAQGLGLTLAEIKEIRTIQRGGRPPCRHVYQLLREKSAELDRKLEDLLALRRRIRGSLAVWSRRTGGKAVVCPHIESARRVTGPDRSRRA